jgi:hypothetical protein
MRSQVIIVFQSLSLSLSLSCPKEKGISIFFLSPKPVPLCSSYMTFYHPACKTHLPAMLSIFIMSSIGLLLLPEKMYIYSLHPKLDGSFAKMAHNLMK